MENDSVSHSVLLRRKLLYNAVVIRHSPLAVKPLKPFKHTTGKWAVQFSAKLSGTGKRLMKYYATETDAKKDIKARQGEREEHGKQAVTAEERHWILFAKKQLGDLELLPDVIHHWRHTGAGSIAPTLVSDAVQAFQTWQLP
jgi:hypothetical protein